MRMHIGFSFKPKTLLIVLAVILGVVGACVDAYAAEPDNDIPDWALVPALDPDEDTDRGYTTVYDMDGSVLYTDDPALEADDTWKRLPPCMLRHSFSYSMNSLPLSVVSVLKRWSKSLCCRSN